MDDQQTDDQKNGEPAAPEQPAAEQRGSEGLNPWSLLAVLAVFAVGVVLIINWHWRRGSVVIGASVTLAGVLRLLLPPKLVGLLQVRSKPFDVTLLLSMGLAIMVLGMIVPGVYEP